MGTVIRPWLNPSHLDIRKAERKFHHYGRKTPVSDRLVLAWKACVDAAGCTPEKEHDPALFTFERFKRWNDQDYRYVAESSAYWPRTGKVCQDLELKLLDLGFHSEPMIPVDMNESGLTDCLTVRLNFWPVAETDDHRWYRPFIRRCKP